MEVRIRGPGASPDKISVSELIRFLGSIEQALYQIAKSKSHEPLGENFYVSLVEVKEGSALFRFKPSMREAAFVAATLLSASMISRDFSVLPVEAVNHLSSAVAFVQKQSWTAEVKLSASDSQPAFVIDSQTPIPEITPFEVTGETVLYGEIERVGGQDPKVGLRLPDGSWLSCTVSKDMAQVLAGRLYTVVGLRGSATWEMPSLELSKFQISELLDFTHVPFAVAMKELADDLRPHYSDIRDSDAYLRRLRSEEG